MQQALLHGRKCGEAELLAGLPEATLERRHRVMAEVVVVADEHRLQQQPDLDILDLLLGFDLLHFGIQTRTRERSFSTSSGLAM